jgi:hypothetical protein
MNNNNLENSKSDNSNNSEDYNQPKLNIDNTEHKQRKVRKKVTQACENKIYFVVKKEENVQEKDQNA